MMQITPCHGTNSVSKKFRMPGLIRFHSVDFNFQILQTGDFLTIYDGSNDQSTKIVKLIGNLGSFSISNTQTSLFVKFISYDYGHYGGFIATIHYGII